MYQIFIQIYSTKEILTYRFGWRSSDRGNICNKKRKFMLLLKSRFNDIKEDENNLTDDPIQFQLWLENVFQIFLSSFIKMIQLVPINWKPAYRVVQRMTRYHLSPLQRDTKLFHMKAGIQYRFNGFPSNFNFTLPQIISTNSVRGIMNNKIRCNFLWRLGIQMRTLVKNFLAIQCFKWFTFLH